MGESLGKKGGMRGEERVQFNARFSLTPTRVESGRGSHHSSRRGFPSKYKMEWGGKVAKREVKEEHVQTPADTCQ